ncbi:hypothetical protein IMZ48_06675 [Candidatus Bathyarchaeota archaeon]|nr:hypothetical protein [Candidatus Bathyarchaeota archaeon]
MLPPGACESFLPHDDRLSHRIDSFDDPELLNQECVLSPPPEDRCFSSNISTRAALVIASSSRPSPASSSSSSSSASVF